VCALNQTKLAKSQKDLIYVVLVALKFFVFQSIHDIKIFKVCIMSLFFPLNFFIVLFFFRTAMHITHILKGVAEGDL